MTKFKINKTLNSTPINNKYLHDNRMSLNAGGLLYKILSLSNKNYCSVDDLINIVKEDKNTVYKVLKELQKLNYITIRNNVIILVEDRI